MARHLSYDRLLFSAVLGLCFIGTVMIYSSSSVVAIRLTGNANFFFSRHLMYLGLGAIALVVGMRVDYRKWAHRNFLLAASTGVVSLLVLALFSPARNGAHRWVGFGGFTFQPVEAAKVVFLLFACAWVARHPGALAENWKNAAPLAIFACALAGMVYLQPDMGSAALIMLGLFLVLFLGGWSLSAMGLMGAIGLLTGIALVFTEEYRLRRVMSFLNPDLDPMGAGFQVRQSWLAIGSGGLTGKWLMGGGQKFLYLPEPHTDFIFAIIGEELGLIGCLLLIGLFLLFALRGLRTGFNSHELFGKNLAFTMTLLIASQAAINLMVVLGLVPTKGVPLPFISYGGSALMFNLFMAGVLLNISKQGHHS